MPKNKVDPVISAHFRALQKKSWEARKRAMLDKAKKKVDSTKRTNAKRQ